MANTGSGANHVSHHTGWSPVPRKTSAADAAVAAAVSHTGAAGDTAGVDASLMVG
jgi:hypothetical protein